MKIVIVGGVAGGMSAATRLRRLDEQAEIIILEKGPYVSFANCGLPYYISEEISERSDLIVQSSSQLSDRFQLDIRENSEAVAINADKKEITVRKNEETYSLPYDKLILSPGAKPFIPPAAGIENAKNIFTLRNIPDVDAITSHIEKYQPKKAVVIGAGYIGLEMVESLTLRGLAVTVVEKAPHVLPTFDEEMAVQLANELTDNGVQLYTGIAASSFEEEGKIIILEDGTRLESDLTILSVGVQPESVLAEKAGIETGIRGGILVDENYETSQKDIYAVGDAIIVKQQITGEDTMIALASPANRQGRQVADIICGLTRKNKGSMGTAIVRLFRLAAAATGLNEQQLKKAGLSYEGVHIQAKSHAGYYPGAQSILLKLLFHPENGKIYGAQAIGADGVDKRIDVIATAIKGNLTVEDLPELELAYAPPFGSAKDPVNLAGYAASNIVEGLSENIQWYDLEKMQAKGYQLIDVREWSELEASGKIKGSLHLPLNQLREQLHVLDKDTKYIVSCHSGLRSYLAERILKQNGFSVKNLDGAFSLYAAVKPERIDSRERK